MRLSIRYKFIVGLLCIFCVGFNLIDFLMDKIATENNKEIITKEFLNYQRDSAFYIRQYLKINSISENSKEFSQKVGDIASALSLKLDDRVIMYSTEGQFLFDTAYENGEIDIYDNKEKSIKDNKEDIELAMKNKLAYSVLKDEKRSIVCFSYPLIIENNRLGIIRCIKDYSYMFKANEYLLKLIKIVILIIFIIIFLFSVLLTTKITIPIIKLNKGAKEIAQGNYDFIINIKSKDEIGELAESFNNMKGCIREQIQTIEKDRDDLRILENHRKRFFDNITHEMKTPLTIISGYVQIMTDKSFNDKEFFDASILKLKDEVDRMHNMVLELLDISKLESDIGVEFEKINISKLVYKVCEEMDIKAQKYEIKIIKIIEDNLVVFANEELLIRAIINIIDNSIKYGNIQSKIKVTVKSDSINCFLIVEDEGKGIPQDKIDKVFEPFYRIDKKYSRENGSSGLGLAIVKNIIEEHKGIIDISSIENVGTKVVIKIPILFTI